MLIDLHLHTCYSHGSNTPAELYAAACSRGLDIMGFSEHSPRPEGFDYTHEYRDALSAHLETYVREVLALRNAPPLVHGRRVRVLFGMEMDWLQGEEDFARTRAKAYDFDYLIGSVHFIGHWGFDDGVGPWRSASQEQCERWYEAYVDAWHDMLQQGLYQIAAHPDLVKIFSCEQFHVWLAKAESRARFEQCLRQLKKSGMAMEVSSAGLRKACHEIYPCAEIMEMAARLEVPVTLASDAHGVSDVAADFPTLAAYVRSFGYTEQVVFDHGRRHHYPLPF